ncbi:MAG TPA: histidine kinase [Solirubrobacteraceae bacterium]|nr:histidine kinase [Solirubrobacteraceae bacterium]
MRAWLTPSDPRFELALAVLLALAARVELAVVDVPATPVRTALCLLMAAPIALRRRLPLLAVTLTSLAAGAESALPGDDGQTMMPIVCMLLTAYAVGARCAGWRVWAGGAIAAALGAASITIREGLASDLALGIVLPAIGVLIGKAAGVLRLETEVLEERATALERDRDRHTRLAIQSERGRIARELHDVIGHSISVMGVQAGAVRSVLPDGMPRERDTLLAIERAGREAVGEMRRLIGLLRTDDDVLDGPRPSLARVESLAEEMRGAGQDLALAVEGDVGGLTPGVDLAGYRIVQEALTNALKHAAGARVTASVVLAGDVLEIDVADDGPGPAPLDGHVGHGLLGMRERAALYGGQITTGPGPSGGFRVHALLPAARDR